MTNFRHLGYSRDNSDGMLDANEEACQEARKITSFQPPSHNCSMFTLLQHASYSTRDLVRNHYYHFLVSTSFFLHTAVHDFPLVYCPCFTSLLHMNFQKLTLKNETGVI